jgi:hypothetical protein
MAAPPDASGSEPRDQAIKPGSTDNASPEDLARDDISPANANATDADPTYSEKDGKSKVIHNARAAAAKEQNMTLLQGIRLYPKAIFWSILISTCIVMEGYDISLVNNFCMSSVLVLYEFLNELTGEQMLFPSSIANMVSSSRMAPTKSLLSGRPD